MVPTDEQMARRQLLRLQNFIAACQLPVEAAWFRPGDWMMGFSLRHAVEGTEALVGTFDACMGYLLCIIELRRRLFR